LIPLLFEFCCHSQVNCTRNWQKLVSRVISCPCLSLMTGKKFLKATQCESMRVLSCDDMVSLYGRESMKDETTQNSLDFREG
jgi:hypothetical protein